LCKEARPRLTKIEISLRGHYHDDAKTHEDDGSQPGYDQGFLLCADSLEDLRICADLIRGLPGLASLSRLRYLEASLITIFSSPSTALAGVANICDRLPPSLESISLCEVGFHPWPIETNDWPLMEDEGESCVLKYYGGLLGKTLSGLLLESKEKLPQLRRVYMEMYGSCWDGFHVEAAGLGLRMCTESSIPQGLTSIDCVMLHKVWHTAVYEYE
jgi:hypothetical protein